MTGVRPGPPRATGAVLPMPSVCRDDARAMTLEQVDQLICYHDALSKRYEDTVTRLRAVSDQIEAAMREHGHDVLADPRRTEAAPLRGAWTEAFAEYNSSGREIDAIAAYTKPLHGEEGLTTSPFWTRRLRRHTHVETKGARRSERPFHCPSNPAPPAPGADLGTPP